MEKAPIQSRAEGKGIMTRIKTIGYSLLLLNILLMPGCKRFIPLGAEIDGFILKEEEMDNVRFEPQGLPFSIASARAYWLRRGDVIAPRWDTYEWHWERKGAMPMCGFVDNTSAGDCQVCDFCNPPVSVDGPPCMGKSTNNLTFGRGTLEVIVDTGFIQTDNPQLVSDLSPNIFAGCSNATQGPLGFFEPAASGLYRLRSAFGEAFKFKGATDAEIKLHVVETSAGLAQKTAYQLTRQTVDGKDYWAWTIDGDPLWDENFSPNLRVTDIRILRGRCADGSAQGKQCAVPSESVPVKPSRLLFLPSFLGTVSGHPGEASHRCYSAPNASGGNFINFDSCRETFNANQTIQKLATPAYESDSSRSLEKLTWLVEFNTIEGADAMQPDAELIIEFTIQANN